MAAGGGWVIGTAAQMQQAEVWTPAAHLACMAAAAVLLAAAFVRRGTPATTPALVVAAALAAFGLAGLRAGWRLDDALDPRWEGRDLLVTGEVVSLPQEREQGLGFVFRIDGAQAPADDTDLRPHLPQRVLLSWYAAGEADIAAWTGARPQVRAGQRWRLPVRLRRPHGLANPHAFDVELWWFEQGIRGLGTVRESGGPRLLGEGGTAPVDRLRQALRDRIHLRVADPRSAGVIAALALGDQAAIDRGDWDVFRRTGVAHLVSISGLHVTLFAWLAGGCIAWLWRGSTRLMLWQPAPVAACMGGVAAALAYALFAGWGLPAQRTVWMLAIAALPLLLGRRWPWMLVWLAGGIAVLAIDPWALLAASFWLSFGAVGLLMASARDATQAPPAGWRGVLRAQLREGLRAQAVATVGLAPLALVFFNQLSLVGFAANLVAIPLVSFVITPLALLGGLWAPLWDAAAWLVQAWVATLQWLGGGGWAVWHVPVASWWAQAAALLAAAVALSRLPLRVRLLAWPLVLPLLWPPVQRPPPGSFDLVAADVGQGTAVLVRTAGHLLVYDSGPAFGPRSATGASSDAGERVLLPLLHARGEPRIDRLVLSHGDADHIGGAASLMQALPVGELLSSLPSGHPLQARAGRRQRCEAGQRWSWEGVDFELLHPRSADYAPQGGRMPTTNSLSCVLRISAAGSSVLLTGDVGVQEEAALLARGAALRADVLLAPHHGSGGSSSAAFVAAVRPAVVVFQAGYLNRYGHPATEVLARYRAADAVVLGSAGCGAWQWRIGPGMPGSWSAAATGCERQRTRRYWRHPDAVLSTSPDSGG